MSQLRVLLLSILLLSVAIGCGGKSVSSKKDTPTNQEKPEKGGGDNNKDENKDSSDPKNPCNEDNGNCDDDQDSSPPPLTLMQQFRSASIAAASEIAGMNFGTKENPRRSKPGWIFYSKIWEKKPGDWMLRVKINVPGKGVVPLLMHCHYHGGKAMDCHKRDWKARDEIGDEPFDDQYPEDKPVDKDECDIADDDCIPD